jgi:RNA polymerase sigma factor (sigma-70 family)
MMHESPGPVPPPCRRAGATGLDRMSDGHLLDRLVQYRDQAAFEALVWRHAPMVRGRCRRWLCEEHAAEDACQETFLMLLRKAHLIGQPELLAGWLFGVASRVASRLALRAKRQLARHELHDRETASSRADDPVVEAARRDLRAIVAAAMDGLPERYRAALTLHYWEGKTCEEIARQLGCPLGSVSWLLGRGRELLRRQLGALARESAF